ncbi:unnamed protein product [Orchesella dallaii]|uniref:Serpin domain-containing protein n=1 Tax=Orchesella dallaii TaxID=48710 RepID=A0ABP1RGB4_9HEXA
MTKERKKPEQFSKAVRNCVIVFLVSQYVIQQCSASSEIIGSSVVTSVSVILNGEGRSNKEVYDEVTTSTPLPAYPDLEPAEASSTAETPAVTTLPSTASTAKVPFPVYIHAQPVRNNEEDVVEETTDATVAETSSPPASIIIAESEPEPTAATPSQPPPSPPSPVTLPSFFPMPAAVKSSRRADDDGIRVIDALKDIVRQAQQQHAQNDAPAPAPVTVTLTGNTNKGYGLPPVSKNAMPFQEDLQPQKLIPGTGLNGDDDDEMEFNVNAGSLDPGAATTDVIDDFAKVVVVVQQQPEDNSEGENDTAPSAEVQNNRVYKSDIIDEITASILCQQRADIEECGLDMLVTDAMHKISGALLSSDDDIMQRPVEHIVNDVLGSLNTRNASQAPPQQIPTTTTTRATTTTTTTRPTTTTRRTTTTTTTTTTTPKPTTTTTRTTTTTPTTTTRPPTARTTTTTTTTTPRPTLPPRTTTRATLPPRTTTRATLPPRTTPRPTTTTTRRTTTPVRRQPPPTLRPSTSTTTARTTSSTFLPRITPRVTARVSTTTTTTTTTRRPTTRTTTTTTARPQTVRTSTTLRPRPPQTTESFMYNGNLFNNGMDSKTPQTMTTIVKKDKPVMYSTDPAESDIPPPPYQGAPPVQSTKPPMTTTTQKPMSALEIMIKQSEQMGRPFVPPMVPQFVNSGDVFDPEPVESPQQQQQEVVQQEQPQQPPTDYRIPGIPVDEEVEQSTSASGQLDENDDSAESSSSANVEGDDNEVEQEEAETDADTEVEFTTSTLKPYVPPSKKPINSMVERRPINETSSSKRPNEFYDDEIFGFDPYQTFHHGVYVPVVEVIQPLEDQQGSSSSEEEVYVPPPTAKPKRKRPRPSQSSSNVRPFVKQGKPTKPRPSSTAINKHVKKPVPNLPDYLHRPRPSHLQYQHGAADDTDPITGLLNANYKHPGESYGPETQTFAPDRLLAIPPQALPQNVRKNLTDHHDHHYQHQHGLVVPGHGHGHGHGDAHGDTHGADAGGGGGGHLSNAQVPSQASNHLQSDNTPVVAEKRPDFGPAPPGNPGLEATLTSVDPEMRSFVDINNRIALRLFSSLTNPVSKSSTSYGNMVVSPFTITSSLSMLFLGARGNTASQLDGLLRLDDMLTFNPHMMYHNITQAFLSQPNTAAAMIRLLIADKSKGGILDFYRTRVQHFYDARVEQADYKFAGHLAQSIINQMIRAQIQRHSYELLNYSLPLSGPMSLLTATFFDGQFAGVRDSKVDGMNFIHLAALGRRLFPVPALSVKGNFRAAYDKDLDATAVEIPYTSRDLSLIVMMPGKPGEFSIGGVASLKSKLTLESWTQLMRGFYPRDSFKVVLPRFRHQTAVNLTYTLKRFGLTDLFMSEQAQFKGINGLVDLHVDKNMMHFTEFGTWEKLSDTMRENNMQNNKNLDLIRILRPYVKDQYGHYAEPLSVNDWISMSRKPGQNEQRSRGPPPQPQSMDIRLALRLAHAEEKMKRRQTANGARSNTNPRLEPMRPFMRTKGKRSKSSRSTSGRRHHNKHSHRQVRETKLFARQTESNVVEIEERVLKFERPFIYVLRHNPTGMILMTGQYTEPVTEVLE